MSILFDDADSFLTKPGAFPFCCLGVWPSFALYLSRGRTLCQDGKIRIPGLPGGARGKGDAQVVINSEGFWNPWTISALIALAAIATLIFDILVPLGVAGGVPYVAIVLFGWWLPGRRYILLLAGITTVLTIAGYFLSPVGGIEWVVITNRALVVFAIWVAAILLTLAQASAGRNITLQKKLKEMVEERTRKMEASEDKFRDYAEVSSDWFWEMDENFKFTSFSGRASIVEEVFSAAIGNTRWDMLGIDPLTDPVWRAHLEILMAHQPFRNFTYSYEESKGKPRWWQSSGVPVYDWEGKFCGYRGSGSDVTERKQGEMELIHSSKLATLGEISSGITHELNQPLNIIQMSAEGTLMRFEKGTLNDEQQSKALQRIVSQVQRMSKIINHMRVFARQGIPESAEVFSPLPLMDELLGLLELQTTPSGVELAKDIPDKCGLIKGLPIQLEQVIMNLITNAMDAVRGHANELEEQGIEFQGRIMLGLRDDAPNNQIVIFVSDNGGGIPDQVRERIFDPFFTTKPEGRGTGLGLSISYKIIENMGGTLDVENTTDGALFEITLSRIDP